MCIMAYRLLALAVAFGRAAHCQSVPLAAPGCSPESLGLAAATNGIKILSSKTHSVTNYTFVNDQVENVTAADFFDFCNVTLSYTHPGWNDTVHLTTYLPPDWNGRFLALGGGGMAAGGEALLHLSPKLVTMLLKRRFAISTTDGGHPSDLEAAVDVNPPWVFTSPGNIDLSMLVNFASRSLHDMAVLGKALIRGAYGVGPEYAYFFGASTGGQQGHMLAQRYPDDFDGIVANKPGINWDKFFFSNVYAKLTMDLAGEYPSPCELDALSAAAVNACDELDGVRDGIISHPGICTFDPRTMAGNPFDCNGVPSTFSKIATEVAHAAYTGPRGPNGEFRWYGFSKDVPLHANGTGPAAVVCPEASTNRSSCSPPAFHMSDLWLRYFYAKDASLDLSSITREQFDDLFLTAVNEYESIIGTADPDLSRFKRAGGKMLSWHGMADQLVPVNGSTDYYDRVLAKDGEAQDFYRLFLAPGADHDVAGPGVSDEDCIDYIVDWVEHGRANDTLSAAGITPMGVATRRDICMYPRVQHYRGGDPSLSTSFACA
ncbi:Tannase/feruloyl esterase [Immersiella caudata]|uniref:Carboxylic ester hydrolase n=1 Tax=Immersiella caudata TaxID=314043 RepID=A0AA39WVD9_9PEZI|nr:Tannase/feruloyl esterase [Immersiella caudata]